MNGEDTTHTVVVLTTAHITTKPLRALFCRNQTKSCGKINSLTTVPCHIIYFPQDLSTPASVNPGTQCFDRFLRDDNISNSLPSRSLPTVLPCVHRKGSFTGFIVVAAGSSAVSNIEVYPSANSETLLKYPYVLAKKKREKIIKIVCDR